MCGIFGYIESNQQHQKLFKKIAKRLFLLSESRGKEAAGFAGINKETITIYKTPFPANRLVKDEIFKDFFKKSELDKTSAFIGHSRLVTDGYEQDNKNNQPFIKHGIVGIHNGIIVNKNNLWKKYESKNKETELDSELIPELLSQEIFQKNPFNAIKHLYKEIYGMTNIAFFHKELDVLFLATNNGSLYYSYSKKNDAFIFASEKYILDTLIKNLNIDDRFDNTNQLSANSTLAINLNSLELQLGGFESKNFGFTNISTSSIKNISEIKRKHEKVHINTSLEHKIFLIPTHFSKIYKTRCEKISKLKRCVKCILPETFPYIEFDKTGTCNYCNNYHKINYLGENALTDLIKKRKRIDKQPECLIPFSGGRDSSYCLHFIVKELGIKSIAYSYDWGMLTDLARRNQARMCGKLGVEHILISADIRRKRQNIRKNVLAWLKKPHLGTIPLFMAGDKKYFYYANLLMKQNNLHMSILGENLLETTHFKSGFCGLKPHFDTVNTYSLKLQDKIKMALFYGKEYLLNPSYINSSVFDTLDAFKSYYVIKHNNINLFNYIEWNEKKIEDTLINEYEWETDSGTKTTWRIGDGTAAFYNYIYYMIAGFNENDTFRSNQIREGVLNRKDAIKLINQENIPRYDSIKWYCNTIGIDFESTINRINQIPKLY